MQLLRALQTSHVIDIHMLMHELIVKFNMVKEIPRLSMPFPLKNIHLQQITSPIKKSVSFAAYGMFWGLC